MSTLTNHEIEWWKCGSHVCLASKGHGRKIVLDSQPQDFMPSDLRFAVRSASDSGGLMHPAACLDLEKHPDARLIVAAWNSYVRLAARLGVDAVKLAETDTLGLLHEVLTECVKAGHNGDNLARANAVLAKLKGGG
jgi:hypothetical protein